MTEHNQLVAKRLEELQEEEKDKSIKYFYFEKRPNGDTFREIGFYSGRKETTFIENGKR